MVKKESQFQHDAFEQYFLLGAVRSLSRLHSLLTETAPPGQKAVSLRTLKEWSRVNDWQQRCIIRDAEVARKVEEKSTADLVSVKAKFLRQVQSVIDTAFDSQGKPNIVCDRARDLKDLIDSALKLLGEPEQEPVSIVFNVKKYSPQEEPESYAEQPVDETTQS
jgi:hypothetical protein